MLKAIILSFAILLSCLTGLSAQEQDSTASFMNDYEARKNKVIATYEGFPPTPFEAPDIDGDNHFLHDYRGKVVILQFFSIFNEPGLRQVISLNRLIDEYGQQGLVILGLADNDETDLREFRDKQPVGYPLVPNSRGLGEMAYAAEIGYPRIFIIDKSGLIRKLRAGNSSDDDLDLYNDILPLVKTYLKE